MVIVAEIYSPVLVEPVINLGLGIEGISEVARARRGDPVHGSVSGQDVVGKLLVSALGVLLKESERASRLACTR